MKSTTTKYTRAGIACVIGAVIATVGSSQVYAQAGARGLHVVTMPASLAAKHATTKVRVSPYARAAAAHARAGQLSTGRSPTLVQGMGKPRKPHAAGGR
jgi:hypothetical protein